jgi:hypothetical protein
MVQTSEQLPVRLSGLVTSLCFLQEISPIMINMINILIKVYLMTLRLKHTVAFLFLLKYKKNHALGSKFPASRFTTTSLENKLLTDAV